MRRPGSFEWRNAADYQYLFTVERSAFAWEWLRRNSDYQAAAAQSLSGCQPHGTIGAEEPAAAVWGLHRFEYCDLPAPDARPVWRADRCASVLSATAVCSVRDADALDLDSLRHFATVVTATGVERLLLSDGCRSVRVDVGGASLLSGPVRLRYVISGIAAATNRVLALRRLIALASDNKFSLSLDPVERRARRHILLLRTFDALQAGADQRQIAAELLSRGAREPRWRANSPSLRSQVQRLVRGARALAAGKFWELLR